MRTLDIIRKSFGLSADDPGPVGDYSARVMPPPRPGDINTRQALTLPAVYRAVQLVSGIAAQLPIDAWRGSTVIDTPPILTQPDPWRDLGSWVERVVVCLATEGNAFLHVVRDASNAAVALIALDPWRVTIWRDKNGAKMYNYADPVTSKSVTYTSPEIVHLWAMEVPGLTRALGPIGHARASVSGAVDVRDFATNWFRSGDTPTGVLTTDKVLDPESAKFYKDQWRDSAYEVKVLGQGLTYAPIFIKPEDAQWIEAQQFGVADIARLFGVPAAYLLAAVEGSNFTYANLQQVDAQFLRTTLFPVYLRKIEGALTGVLPRGQRARFNAADLLRPDAQTRATIDQTYVQLGVYDAAYVARREGIDTTTGKATV